MLLSYDAILDNNIKKRISSGTETGRRIVYTPQNEINHHFFPCPWTNVIAQLNVVRVEWLLRPAYLVIVILVGVVVVDVSPMCRVHKECGLTSRPLLFSIESVCPMT